jgi:hypothetical protein
VITFVTAPWIGLIGAISGVLAGGLITAFVERARWKHEERTHWRKDRREAYTRFLQAAYDYALAGANLAVKIESYKGAGAATGDDATPREAAAHVNTSVDALQSLQSEIELVGSPDVREAAASLVQDATDHMGSMLAALMTPEGEARTGAEAIVRAKIAEKNPSEALEEFKRAARAEIGTPD